jgi:N-formylglutamate amidohydrolase
MIAVSLLCLSAHLNQEKTQLLVEVIEGELPIVISAPHGGKLPIPNCPVRVNKEIPQFATVEDTNTNLVAKKAAERIEKLTGKRPWLVIANFSRKYADANRKEEWAYENEAAKETYRAYQNALRKACDKTLATHSNGLLLDIHGQSSNADLAFRGTQNQLTVHHLISDFGEDGFTGESSFLSSLEKSGIQIHPKCSEPEVKENSKYDGGFIVQSFGGKKKSSVVAIQLELGMKYRRKDAIANTASRLADAAISHLKHFIRKR